MNEGNLNIGSGRIWLLIFLGLGVGLTLSGIFYQVYGKINLPSMSQLEKSKIKIGQAEILVELAVNDEQRVRGLSGRKKMPQNEGMLFVFDEKYPFGFWMKGMNFPLDFIWIDDDKVVDITENVPPYRGLAEFGKIYRPGRPINLVLEVNSGFVKRHDIKIGDRVEFDKNL